MLGRRDPIALSTPVRPRRRRRRVRPWTWAVVGLVIAGLIGWLWIWVFTPLFVDPRDWVKNERAFRRVINEVVRGAPGGGATAPELPDWPPPLEDYQQAVVTCAEQQVARGVRYTRGYHRMEYPWGDIPKHLATAPDIVIRCLRTIGPDLQQLIHVDRVKHPLRYPLHIWAHPPPDKSIDHRRLANLYSFIRAFGERMPALLDTPEKLAAFLPGDLVFWASASGGEFPGLVGIVTDRRTGDGLPFVVTVEPSEEYASDHHLLTDWTVQGHYRIDPDLLLERFLEANPDARLEPKPGS